MLERSEKAPTPEKGGQDARERQRSQSLWQASMASVSEPQTLRRFFRTNCNKLNYSTK